MDASGRSSLVGLKTLGVSVAINDAEVDAGVTRDQIQTEVEITLQKGGLRVYSVKDKNEDPEDEPSFGEFVHVRVTVIKVPLGYAYTIETSVSQVVKIARTNQFAPGTTWSKASYGSDLMVAQKLKDAVIDHAKLLVNDWLKANTRGSTIPTEK